jgi:hypothetical protein
VTRALPLLLLLLLACSRDPKLRPVPPCEPSEEVCDGVDNNCDDKIDNVVRVCVTACESGIEVCRAGVWGACTAQQPAAETCNGLDDDCDDVADEPSDLAVTPCYPGDQTPLRFGECRFGLTRCQAGKTVCAGAIVPQVEQCNGLDDDCDGSTDEGFSSAADLVFIVDNSCSMWTSISNVQQAVNSFAQSYVGRSDIRWAIVGAPEPQSFEGKIPPKLLLQFSDPDTFASVMAKQDGNSGSSYEPTLDAIEQSADGTLGLEWKAKNRAIIVLSDEEPQSYATPAVTALNLGGIRLHVFTTSWAAAPWARFGAVHSLSLSPSLFAVELENVITEVSCD